jgi:folate-binding protein YgfZ
LSDALLRFDPAVRHLACRGRDAFRFLHAVTTQDLASLAPGQGAYGALVTDRGRPIADFYAFRFAGGDEVLLEIPEALADACKDALEKLVVADDVELSWLSGETVAVAALDGGAAIALSALGDAAVRAMATVSLRAPRLGLDSIVLRGAEVAGAVAAVRAATPEEVAWRALAWGRPGAAEFERANVLNELGILHAVSFTKGCFMGQEILQRVRTQGELKRRLVGLEIEGVTGDAIDLAAFAPEAEITRAAPRTGHAGAGFVALAFARIGSDRPGRTLQAAAPDASDEARAGLRATVTEPPFLRGAALEPGRDLLLLATA